MIDKFEKLQIIDSMLLILQNELTEGLATGPKDVFKFIQRIREIIADILICLK